MYCRATSRSFPSIHAIYRFVRGMRQYNTSEGTHCSCYSPWFMSCARRPKSYTSFIRACVFQFCFRICMRVSVKRAAERRSRAYQLDRYPSPQAAQHRPRTLRLSMLLSCRQQHQSPHDLRQSF